MNDTARLARQSDRELNPAFRRRWIEHAPPPAPRPAPRPAPAAEAEAEPGMATLLAWRDEWRARRAASARKGAAP